MKTTVIALAALAATALPPFASAQDAYPNRVVKLIVPFAAGGNTDVVGRVTADYMQRALNVNVVVENRAGAGGITGTDALAKAAPDGYTLCVCGVGPITVSPAIEKLPYDPLKDLAPISLINTNPLILIVNPKVAANTAAELVALSKSQPGGLSYGTSGAGGLMHFSAEIFRVKTGAKLTAVPYRGGALATTAVVSGEVQLAFSNMSDAVGQIAAATVRPLAITTAKRSPHTPNVPTLVELGLVEFPIELVERAAGAGRHAAADHRSAGRGDGADGQGWDGAKADGGFRLDRGRQLAEGICRDAARGDRAMGEGAQGDRPQAVSVAVELKQRDRTLRRRDMLGGGLAAFSVAALGSLPASAQGKYPDQPIRFIVPRAAGGVVDVVARLWAEQVRPQLGNVVIENQGGGGGTIAAAAVARAKPDGYTLLAGTTSELVISPVIMSNPSYDPVRDLAPIAITAVSVSALMVRTNRSRPRRWRSSSPTPRPIAASCPMAPPASAPRPICALSCSSSSPDCPRSCTCPTRAPIRGSRTSTAGTCRCSPPASRRRCWRCIAPARSASWSPAAIGVSPAHRRIPISAEVGFPDLITLQFMGVFAPAERRGRSSSRSPRRRSTSWPTRSSRAS